MKCNFLIVGLLVFSATSLVHADSQYASSLERLHSKADTDSEAKEEAAIRETLKTKVNQLPVITETTAMPLIIEAMVNMMNVLKKYNLVVPIAPENKMAWAEAACAYIGTPNNDECLKRQHPDSGSPDSLWNTGNRGFTNSYDKKIYWSGTSPNSLAWHEVLHKVSAVDGQTTILKTMVENKFNEGLINYLTKRALEFTGRTKLDTVVPPFEKRSYPRETWEVGGLCESAFDACIKMFANNGDFPDFAGALYDASGITTIKKEAFINGFKNRFKYIVSRSGAALPSKLNYQPVCNALKSCKRCYDSSDIRKFNEFLGTTEGMVSEATGLKGPTNCEK